jgi:iron complex outermembrane recepter protein
MKMRKICLVAFFFAGVSTGSLAHAQASEKTNTPSDPEIIVTGSRVVRDGTAAPTPLTTVSTQNLLATTPSTLAVALKTLPQFVGSSGQRNIGLSGSNVSGNTLNLRNFGAQRNLILLDGTRVPPSTSNGTVNVDTMPEMFIQRVDIVTGGASAVYGSDAVTGVVNYIIDKKFNGIKFDGNAGISRYGDDKSWKFGIAYGTKVGDRGHFEASYTHYNEDGIIGYDQRPHGGDVIIAAGNGTASAPYTLFSNGRFLNGTRGSYIVSGPASILNYVFTQNGIAQPFTHGIAYGPAGFESGGDGGILNSSTLYAPLRTDQFFGRFDYALADHVNAYVQGSFNRAAAAYQTIPNFILGNGPIGTGVILSGNPYLPASIQSAMTAAGANSITIARSNDDRDGYKPESTNSKVDTYLIKAGLDGKLFGKYIWGFNYSHGSSRQYVVNVGNLNAEKQSAALDAVIDPRTGGIVCAVSLTAYASRFPGCIPLNPFGPTAPSQSSWDFIRTNTISDLINTTDDFNLSISGSPFATWAVNRAGFAGGCLV